MLGKLIKHDLNYSKKSFFAIAALMIILAIVAATSLTFDVERISAISIAILAIVLTASIIITIALIFNGYRRSLFGPNGYLYLTLPVSKNQLLLSKIIGALIWVNFMIIVTFIISVTIATVIATVGARIYSDYSWIWIRNEISLVQIAGDMLFGLLFINVLAFVAIIILFMTITLANVSFRNKRLHWIFAGVFGLAYFILYSRGAELIVRLFYDMTTFSTARIDVTVFMIYSFIVGIISYLITLHLLMKRIELD